MPDVLINVAKLVAAKVVTWVLAMLLALGIIVPAALSDRATAALAVVIAVGLQVLYQLAAALAEKYWPAFAKVRVSTLRQARRKVAR